MTAPRPLHERASAWMPALSALVAFAVYAGAAARTITWWDGSSYPLAAVTLGIPGAPGSLLLTLLGWAATRILIVHPAAFQLNLLAGILAATLVGLVSWIGARLATPEDRAPGLGEQLAGALAGLTLAFGLTPWTYAIQFTPYVLSALWTALILIAALAWWRRPERSAGLARLFLFFLLLGLDVSVHRTNTLLLPAAVVWVALRRSAGPRFAREGAAALAGLAAGLAFHLLLMPIAARRPGYMVEDPSTWAGFWSYISIGQKGGGFLVKLFPRTADFLKVQLTDYLAFLGRNLSPVLFLPAILAVLGWLIALRHHPRRTIGLMIFFLFAGFGAVIYFNLPRGYMRPIDRHYLPSLVILAPWIAVGAAGLLRGVRRLPAHAVLVPSLALVMALPPLAAWRANHRACDLSRNRFTETFARDLLEPLPPGAILLTNGDNDTFPLWYLQQAEGVRRDVRVINLPLTNTGTYVAKLRRDDPDLARLFDGEPLQSRLVARRTCEEVATVVEPRTGLGLPAGVAAPDTVRFRTAGICWPQDLAVLEMLRVLRWRRPVFLASTVAPSSLTWLWPYARLDGLAFRVIPSADSTVWEVDHLRHQLLERVRYTDIADPTVAMDDDTRRVYSNYPAALVQLASAELERGRTDAALATIAFLDRHTPPARLGWDSGEGAALLARIRAEADRASRRAVPSR